MNINKISSMSFGAKPITTTLMFDNGKFQYQRACGKDVDCFVGNIKKCSLSFNKGTLLFSQ